MFERVLGDTHVEVVRTLNKIGYLHWLLQDVESAKRSFDRALTIIKQTEGSDHREVGWILTNLGLVLQDLKDFEGARESQKGALAIFKNDYGPRHPGTILAAERLNKL
jgi:tetratricopeptide (TPR) repeat protein